MSEHGRYLYAVTRDLDPRSLVDVPALGDGRLEVVAHRDLSAVVSDVDLEEYGEEGLRENLERLDWLEQVARTHDAVVHAVAGHGPVAPLRLATICLDDDGVRRRLDEWYAALEQVLDRVTGRMEWSVKAYLPARPEPATPPAPDAGAAGGGAAYLQRKRTESRNRLTSEADAVRVAEELHERLQGHAVASRRLPAQDPRLSGHEGTMVHNGAYLVGTADGAMFEEAVRTSESEHPGLVLECRGPWPPYSFAMLEQS